jgi:uncharacterized damage-inducible protein DinB
MKSQLLKTLQNSKDYTLAVAEAMPEKLYTFKPTEPVWNFKELIDHIAYGIQWWESNYIKEIKTDWNPPTGKNAKQEIIANLRQAYDSLETTINSTSLNDKMMNGFYATLDHITHHRAQAITYLRCQNIAAPDYIY